VGVAETSLTICRLFDYLLTIPVNCNALKTLHVWENVMNFTLVAAIVANIPLADIGMIY
jgi:hypothetical protein